MPYVMRAEIGDLALFSSFKVLAFIFLMHVVGRQIIVVLTSTN
jgi:hypothetical protein